MELRRSGWLALLLMWLLWLLPRVATAQATENLDSLYCKLQTRLEMGLGLEDAKEHEAANDTLAHALTEFPGTLDGRFKRLLAEFQFAIGYGAYYAGDTGTARVALHEADTLLSQVEKQPSVLRARILRQQGMITYFADGNAIGAQELYGKAYRDWMKMPQKDSLEIAIVLQCMGQAATKLGEYEKAIDLYQQSLKIREKMFGPMHPRVGLIYLNLGNAYGYSDQFEAGANSYQKALDIYTKVSPSDLGTQAKIMLNLGVTYIELREFESAIYYLKKSINLKRTLTAPFSLELTNYLTQLAVAYAETSQFDQAAKAQQEFAAICAHHHIEDGKYVATLKFMEATILRLKKADKETMLERLQSAMAAISIGKDLRDWRSYPDYQTSKDPILLLQIIQEKSKILSSIGRSDKNGTEYLEASLKGYEIASQLSDKLRRDYEDQDDKLYLSAKGSEYLSDALSCSQWLWNATDDDQYIDRAFRMMENNKFQLLLDFFRKSRIQLSSDESSSNVHRLDSIRRKCMELDYVLALPTLDQDSQAFYQSTLIDLRLQQRSLQDSLERESRLFKAMYGQEEMIGIDSFQKLIPSQTLALSFAIDDSSLFVIAVSKQATSIRMTRLPEHFVDSVSKWIQLCRQPVENPTEIQQFARLGHLIYTQLLQPEVEKSQGIERLLLIPDGILGNLSFEALLTAPPHPDTKGFVQLPYLLHKFRCQYAASANLWMDQMAMQFGPKPMECFGMAWGGDPVDSIPGFVGRIAGLKGTEKELQTIREMVDGRFVFGKDATESIFKSNAAQFDILHLAMHAIASETDPQVLFTSGGDPKEDGILHFHELFPLRLRARLAVLSACETGQGKVNKGEGIQSISSGFAAAGVPSLLMSLWEVDDRAGSQIISTFYEGLRGSETIEKSLHEAKLRYLAEANGYEAAPFYWSAFVPYGNMEPIALKPPPTDSWWLLWTGSFVFLCIFFSYRIYKKNRKSI